MRASLLAVVVFALVSGCSPDEPDVVAVVSEPTAPEPEQPANLPELLGAVRQVQVEEDCRLLVAFEARLRELQTRYTEQHPEVMAVRSEIARVRSGLPADGTFCSEQLEQRLRAVEPPRQN